MGQYFLIVNLDKKEYIDPDHLDGGPKLWEICANNTSRVIPYLLRQSTGRGGGDIGSRESYELYKKYTDEDGNTNWERVNKEIEEAYSNAGRWAGDRVVVVGDYDESGLYRKAEEEFTEISNQIAEEFNRFIEFDDSKVKLGEEIQERKKSERA